MTGAPALIPRFALGNWWSRNTIYDSLGIHELIRNFERENIPLAVMVFDHDWHIRGNDSYKRIKSGFTFNTELIKDPKEMIDEFHKKGVRIGLVINPTNGIYPFEQNYAQAAEFLGLKEQTIIDFDPLNPKLLEEKLSTKIDYDI